MAAPEIVCLCGSTRFMDEFNDANRALTTQGKIVLTVARISTNVANTVTADEKLMLDELHKRKIDLAHRVLVLNVGGYIGVSTRSEIEYAVAHGVPVDYLEPLPGAAS